MKEQPTNAVNAVARVECQPTEEGVEWRFSGVWHMDGDRTEATACLQQQEADRMVLKDVGIQAWDSSLVIYVRTLYLRAKEANRQIDLSGMPEGVRRLMALAEAVPEHQDPHLGVGKPSWIAQVGIHTLRALDNVGKSAAFLGDLFRSFVTMLQKKSNFRWGDFWVIVQECGPEALPIVTLISTLVGMILAFIGAIQLKMFGAEIFIADIVAVGMAREMGGLMTGIIMAGRTGAAFAAHLGTMQVNEEIDALRTLGFSPMEFLVLPRALALILMMPLLTIYSMTMGMLGGSVVGVFMLGLTPVQYLNESLHSLSLWSVTSGVLKSVVFGVVVAVSGCMQGLQSGRSAAAVGEATTAAVVHAIVYLVVADSVISVFYTLMGW
ncbi:MAG: ABC transporter permease [Verrucomicrobiota bacterium]|jgi:phospholipid/cholesterol/gamma-HCH transport system permease protein|nr:ABC transporter permease [Verrucomicrobiota bacterium]